MKTYSAIRPGTWSLVFLGMVMFWTMGCTSSDPYVEDQQKDGMIRLVEGNMRFIQDHSRVQDNTLRKIKELNAGQNPFAVILSCSDSRVPPEIIFDQKLGDLFVIRNAGNVLGDHELGSIEYAVEHLHTPLVVVMGHTGCGAIGAFLDHQMDTIPNHIQSIIDYIKSEHMEEQFEPTHEHYYEAVRSNVVYGVHALKTSKPIISELVEKGQVEVVGVVFNLETGKVIIVER